MKETLRLRTIAFNLFETDPIDYPDTKVYSDLNVEEKHVVQKIIYNLIRG